MQPIRQTELGLEREAKVANYLTTVYPWVLTPTPKYYFTDFHINEKQGNGFESYIGDLEVLWCNYSYTQPTFVAYTKLQQMSILPLFKDLESAYHRLVFRFTDGLFIVPVEALQPYRPIVHNHFVREDVTKLVVRLELANYMQFYKPIVIR